MPKRYFEDFVKGSVAEYGPGLVTREEIVSFAAEFDPQPMHLDEQAARSSILGGLAASGWHTCGLAMSLIATGPLHESSGMGSPGVDEVRWLAPLRPGDRVTLRMMVLDTRPSRSKPDIGFLVTTFDMLNQNGTTIMTMRATFMLGRRPVAAEA